MTESSLPMPSPSPHHQHHPPPQISPDSDSAAHTAVNLEFLSPTDAPSNNLDFLQFSPTTHPTLTGYNVSGSLETEGADMGWETTGSRRRTGAAGRFMDRRGFGWLLEVEDEDDSDKPLLEELDIDIRDIYYKIRCVLLPLPYFRLKLTLVRDSPDFWGPLLVVLLYALVSLYGQISVVSWILTIWFLGSLVIFFLARVLGGDVGYSQCLGVIGYCLIPLVLTGFIFPLLTRWHFVAISVKLFGVLWAVYSAGNLLCVEELRNKRPLVLYPVFLLYIYFFSLFTGV